jgi:hypothetical protein
MTPESNDIRLFAQAAWLKANLRNTKKSDYMLGKKKPTDVVAGELESALALYEVAVSKNKSTREIDKLQRKANDLLRKARSSLKAKQFTPLKQQYDAITSAKGKKWNESVESKPITRSGKEVPPKKQQSLRKAAEIPPRQMKRAQDKYDRFNTPGFIENNERKGKRFRP